MNKLGHSCSYDSLTRLHTYIAKEESTLYDMPSHALENCFAVKAVDNFDYCPETIHGKNSIHIVTQIIVQNPTNLLTLSTSTPSHIRPLNITASLTRRPRQRNINDDALPSLATSSIDTNNKKSTTTTNLFHPYKQFEDKTFDIIYFVI
ncbi:unnamed protein product [Didymodactylos carnosus]|uniref:Uncharacterized protein n=1 Tax=Didymodactylos carnosus TaxID=1234261 RepID=A0A815YBI3_9BILA|nr:unnamed protein product [Didymodactylos carnosus]CAF4432367.1 unnamed protein product [Didymodactylos carnosus]